MAKLGQTVRDVITGYEGIVTSRTEYLHGCVRIVIQSKELKDGVPVADIVIDEQRGIVLDNIPNIIEEIPSTDYPGGDRPRPPEYRRY